MELRFPSPSRLSYSSYDPVKDPKVAFKAVLRQLASSSSLGLCFTPDEGNTGEVSQPDGPGACRETADPTPKELTWRVLSVVETSGLAVVAGVSHFSETLSSSSSSYSSSYSSYRRFVLFLPYLGLQTVGLVGRVVIRLTVALTAARGRRNFVRDQRIHRAIR